MDDKTTGLGIGEYKRANYPYLIRLSNREKVIITKPVFSLGRDGRCNDYTLAGITTVSRAHARIFERNGRYYIMDLGSTNKTFINGEPLSPNAEAPLIQGTKIRLAKEDFVFYV